MTVAPCIAAVEIARLEKCYGPLKVLHDISLTAQPQPFGAYPARYSSESDGTALSASPAISPLRTR